MYEDLTEALDRTDDAELARLAAGARAGERALADWALRVESFRGFKRQFELDTSPRAPAPAAGAAARQPSPWIVEEPGAPPFFWEALAFIVGFIVSFLIT
jgi:hypothetical protein